MDNSVILFAKITALKKSFESLNYGRIGRAYGTHIEPLFPRYEKLVAEIKELLPDYYSDLPDIPIPKPIVGFEEPVYAHKNIEPLLRNLDYILEVHSHSRIGEKIENENRPRRIFISHGTSKEWYKVQAFLEKHLQLATLELAQEANLGRTVLQKLNEEANRCGYAVIVMTGDDVFEDAIKARENVLHEIGFFQGKHGLQNVVLLHQDGVNIPSNIHGLVYIPFPQDTVEATFGALSQELKVMIG